MKQCALSVYYRSKGSSIFEAVFPDIAKATAAARTLLECSTKDIIIVVSLTTTDQALEENHTDRVTEANYMRALTGVDESDLT